MGLTYHLRAVEPAMAPNPMRNDPGQQREAPLDLESQEIKILEQEGPLDTET